MPASVAEGDVVSRIVEDVDLNEPAPPAVSPAAPITANRRDTKLFAPQSLSVLLRDQTIP